MEQGDGSLSLFHMRKQYAPALIERKERGDISPSASNANVYSTSPFSSGSNGFEVLGADTEESDGPPYCVVIPICEFGKGVHR